MAILGYQLIKTNPTAAAVTLGTGLNVLFDNIPPINPNVDGNISYNPVTGVFTFTNAGNYYISWNVNTQTAVDVDVNFTLEVLDALGAVTHKYTAASVFKTGQMSGFALVSPVAGGQVQLVNTSVGTVTFAIGTGMVTAGISLMAMPTISGIQGYLLGGATSTVIPANSPIPFDDPAGDPANSAVTLNTTTAPLGTITFNAPGTYIIDWWAALDYATGATEVTLQLIDNAAVVLAESYHAVVTKSHISGFAVITVTAAQVTAGYTVTLNNETVDTSTTAIPIGLSPITKNAAIRITGNLG